jgi:hypothetical protein
MNSGSASGSVAPAPRSPAKPGLATPTFPDETGGRTPGSRVSGHAFDSPALPSPLHAGVGPVDGRAVPRGPGSVEPEPEENRAGVLALAHPPSACGAESPRDPGGAGRRR